MLFVTVFMYFVSSYFKDFKTEIRSHTVWNFPLHIIYDIFRCIYYEYWKPWDVRAWH